MRETEKEREQLKASHPKKKFINEQKKKVFLTVFAWAYILPKTIQIKKNEQKQLTITGTK